MQLGGSAAVLGAVAVPAQSGCTRFDQVKRDQPTAPRRDDEGISLIAGGHHALGAAQAIALGQGLAVRGPVAAAALLPSQTEHSLACGQLGQPRRLRRELAEHAAADQRLRQGLEHQAAAELFHHHHGFHRAHAHPALVLGHGQAGQAQLGQLTPDLARKSTAAFDLAPTLKRVGFIDPAGHGLAQLQLVV